MLELVVDASEPVATFLAMIFAPGMTAWLLSVTKPVIVPNVLCPAADEDSARSRRHTGIS